MWYDVIHYEPRGRIVDRYSYCPECFPRQAIQEGRATNRSRTEVRPLTPHRQEECNDCGREPREAESKWRPSCPECGAKPGDTTAGCETCATPVDSMEDLL